jgi:hypothetical protein
MLTVEELDEIKRYVLRELPRVLEQDPQFVVFIEGIVSEKFPRRDEFARLLDELTALRLEQNQQFQKVDQRFEQVDQRFEQVDQCFVQVRQEMREQGEQLRQEMREQGEQLRQEMREQGEQLRQEMREQGEQLRQEMRDLRDWVELIGGRLQNRVGRRLEDIVAGALRLGLSRPDVDPQNVRLRQKISDPTGLVYKPGKQKEVDLVVQDGELLVFEVKSAADVDDVDDFADKVELVRLQNPDKLVTGVLVALGAEAEIRQHCARRQVQLIP